MATESATKKAAKSTDEAYADFMKEMDGLLWSHIVTVYFFYVDGICEWYTQLDLSDYLCSIWDLHRIIYFGKATYAKCNHNYNKLSQSITFKIFDIVYNRILTDPNVSMRIIPLQLSSNNYWFAILNGIIKPLNSPSPTEDPSNL